MRIRNAYYVYINFDGDIPTETNGSYVFTTFDEVVTLVKQALIDMLAEYPGHGDNRLQFLVDNEKELKSFLQLEGGFDFGNWEISIDEIE